MPNTDNNPEGRQPQNAQQASSGVTTTPQTSGLTVHYNIPREELDKSAQYVLRLMLEMELTSVASTGQAVDAFQFLDIVNKHDEPFWIGSMILSGPLAVKAHKMIEEHLAEMSEKDGTPVVTVPVGKVIIPPPPTPAQDDAAAPGSILGPNGRPVAKPEGPTPEQLQAAETQAKAHHHVSRVLSMQSVDDRKAELATVQSSHPEVYTAMLKILNDLKRHVSAGIPETVTVLDHEVEI